MANRFVINNLKQSLKQNLQHQQIKATSTTSIASNSSSKSTSDDLIDHSHTSVIIKKASAPRFTKQHFVKYSMHAEAQPNTNSYENSAGVKKRSDFSESRERLTHIRYFYADAEIDKAAEKPLIRLNPMTMLYMGVSMDNSHLLTSANYLRNELPIRLAHLIKEFRNLPFIVACNPHMLEIHERCIKTFRSFDQFDKEIKDIQTEKKFNQIVFEMLEMNKDILALLCDGFKETRKYIKNEGFIKNNLNRILSARMGIRLLCEHHIALNKQSSLNKILLSNTIDEDSVGNNTNDNNRDQFNSSYLNGDSNGNNNPNHNGNLVGILHKRFSPKSLIETSGRMVTRICLDKYGVSPKIKIDGHTNATFPYLPLPLEYILPELLKNSFRATYEHHKSSPSLPDVSVTIAVNEKDFVIRIRDRGGGIPHSLIEKIFDYHFTTAAESENDPNKKEDPFDPGSSVVGMICEASSSRGLAVMHGYGFGLPTSKAYAEYLGGSLSFQSMQGIGTDFYLRLGRLDIEPELVRI